MVPVNIEVGAADNSWLAPRWRRLPIASRAQLAMLVLSGRHVPDFITPLPPVDRPTVAQELQAVRETPLEFLRRDLRLGVRLGEPDPQYARIRDFTLEYADRVRRPPTAAERAAWDGDTHALTDPTADLLEDAWTTLLQPNWDRIREVLEADISYQLRRIASHGVQRTILEMVGSQSWDGSVVSRESEYHIDTTNFRGPVVFAPSVILEEWPPLAIIATPDPDTLFVGYPSRGRASVIGPFAYPADGEHRTIDAVVGRTRSLQLVQRLHQLEQRRDREPRSRELAVRQTQPDHAHPLCSGQAPHYMPNTYWVTSSRCRDINLRVTGYGSPEVSARVCFYPYRPAYDCNSYKWFSRGNSSWRVIASDVRDGTRFKVELDFASGYYSGYIAY